MLERQDLTRKLYSEPSSQRTDSLSLQLAAYGAAIKERVLRGIDYLQSILCPDFSQGYLVTTTGDTYSIPIVMETRSTKPQRKPPTGEELRDIKNKRRRGNRDQRDQREKEERRAAKDARQRSPGGNSKYARKQRQRGKRVLEESAWEPVSWRQHEPEPRPSQSLFDQMMEERRLREEEYERRKKKRRTYDPEDDW